MIRFPELANPLSTIGVFSFTSLRSRRHARLLSGSNIGPPPGLSPSFYRRFATVTKQESWEQIRITGVSYSSRGAKSVLAFDGNFWSLFLTLDYFSRIYFVGVLLIFIWGCRVFLQMIIQTRTAVRPPIGFSNDRYLNFESMQRKLHSIESFAMVLTSGCCADQIFGVWFTYTVRVTDANPFFALREAWAVSQILICLLVLLDALRRFSLIILERHRSKPSA